MWNRRYKIQLLLTKIVIKYKIQIQKRMWYFMKDKYLKAINKFKLKKNSRSSLIHLIDIVLYKEEQNYWRENFQYRVDVQDSLYFPSVFCTPPHRHIGTGEGCCTDGGEISCTDRFWEGVCWRSLCDEVGWHLCECLTLQWVRSLCTCLQIWAYHIWTFSSSGYLLSISFKYSVYEQTFHEISF